MILNNDHLPFCCQDAVGNFSETSRLSVLHWTFPLDLCAFLVNNFVRASEYAMLLSTEPLPWKSLTGIIITFVLFFRSKISHARWKISLQETTLLLTSGLSITAGQRKSVLWSLERLVDFVFGCSTERACFLRIDHTFWKARWKFPLQNGVVRFYCFTGRF